MVIYAIGDIHGRLDCLKHLYAKVMEDSRQYDGQDKTIVFLGDYIDRGPDSCQVVEFIKNEPFAGFNHIYLRGNHEDMMIVSQKFHNGSDMWLINGGYQTLESYDKCDDPGLFYEHLKWMKTLPLYWYNEEQFLFFVHAGIDPLRPNVRFEDILLWIREPFLSSEIDYGFRVVHGHTPRKQPDIIFNRVGLDTGAFATGVLTCGVFEPGKEVRIIQNV